MAKLLNMTVGEWVELINLLEREHGQLPLGSKHKPILHLRSRFEC